jgi:hypothetical protein
MEQCHRNKKHPNLWFLFAFVTCSRFLTLTLDVFLTFSDELPVETVAMLLGAETGIDDAVLSVDGSALDPSKTMAVRTAAYTTLELLFCRSWVERLIC